MRRAAATLAFALALSIAFAGCNVLNPEPRPAETYLQGSTYTRMVVEIDYQAGRAPRADAVALLKARIDERCHKPDGVQIDQREVAVSQEVWTAQELRDAEKRNRDWSTSGSTASLYIVYVGGGYEADSSRGKVIGVMYGRSSIAIFKDTLEAAANPLRLPVFTANDIERSVLVHEFGHTLGLVNLGTAMVRPHEDTDPEHRGHSSNKDSVMYWAIESDAITSVFTGPPPTQFDADDIADLRAAGGK